MKYVALFLQSLSLAALGVFGHPAQASEAEDKALTVLASGASAGDKCNACRELKTTGSEKAVPALAALLLNPETSHAARIALESMPYPAAGAALREAVEKSAGLVKSGILDSLGERRDVQAVPLIVAALQDPNLHVTAAAAAALGKIATPEAAAALTAAWGKAQGPAREKIADGLLLCAGRLAAQGKKDEAAAIYRSLSAASEPKSVRGGALRNLMQIEGPPAIVAGLSSDDAAVRVAAAGAIPALTPGDFALIVAGFGKYPPASQTAVLMAIRIRADKAHAAVALAAVQSKDEMVRQAALRALGTVGDAAALPVLVEVAAGNDKAAEAARQSLQAICGPQIDEGIVAALRAESDPQRRAGWIAVLETRKPAGAVPVLLEEASRPDPTVRGRAVAAWAKLAGPQDVPPMLGVLLRTEKGPQRDEVERAIRAVCQQIAESDKRADPVLAVFRNGNAADRIELLPLLGRLGGPAARQFISEALGSSDGKAREAAVAALANWPDASPADDLLKLAQTAKTDGERQLALRGFIRVIPLPGKATDGEKLAMLQKAMELSSRDEDRNYILQRASAVRTVESLRFLLPYLDRPALAQVAAQSIVELGRHKELREPHRADFKPALEKAIHVSTDLPTLERGRRYLQAL